MNEDDVLTIEQVRQQLNELSQELDSSSANAQHIRERILISYQRLLDATFKETRHDQ